MGEGEDPDIWFQRLGEVVLIPSGPAVVSDTRAGRLLYLSREGELLRELAGQGDGPGEFRRLDWVRPAGNGQVVTYDRGQQRLSVFDAEGELLDERPLPEAQDLPRIRGPFADGSLLLGRTSGFQGEVGVHRDTVDFEWLTASGERRAFPLRIPETEVYYDLSEGFLVRTPPFAARPRLVDVLPDRLLFHDGSATEILVFGLDGDTVARWNVPDDSYRINAEMREQVIEEELSIYSDRHRRRMLDHIAFPDRSPPITDLRVTSSGEVWVKSAVTDRSLFYVFTAEGEEREQVELPQGLSVREADDNTLVATRQGNLDEDVLVFYQRRCSAGIEESGP